MRKKRNALLLVLLALLVSSTSGKAYLKPMGNLLKASLERNEEIKNKEFALKMLEFDLILGDISEEDYEKQLEVSEEQIALARLTCLKEAQKFLLELLQAKHDLECQKLQLEAREAELQASARRLELGQLKTEDYDRQDELTNRSRQEVRESKEEVSFNLIHWQTLFGDLSWAIEVEDIELPFANLPKQREVEEIINLDKEKEKFQKDLKEAKLMFENTDQYFLSPLEEEKYKAELESLEARLLARESFLEEQAENYFIRHEIFLKRMTDLEKDWAKKERTYLGNKLKLDKGLITQRALRALELELASYPLEILKTKLDAYLASMDFFISMEQSQYWWEEIELPREGVGFDA